MLEGILYVRYRAESALQDYRFKPFSAFKTEKEIVTMAAKKDERPGGE